jgi:hypothetical protein
MSRLLARLSAALVTVILLTLIPTARATTWKVAKAEIPEGATQGQLYSVSCTSASFCLAVGSYLSTGWGAQAEVWNSEKQAWTNFPLESEGRILYSIDCWAQEECAAGGQKTSTKTSLIEEYRDKVLHKLRTVTSPNPTNGKNAEYRGISCHGKEACVATGDFLNTEGGEERGAAFASEDVEGTEGKEGIWSALKPIEFPAALKNTVLFGVSCIAVGECISAGVWGVEPEAKKKTGRAGSESWNKSKGEWVATEAPWPAGAKYSEFFGISCKSATFCMAVGRWSKNISAGPYNLLAETWNGSKWTIALSGGGSEGATESQLHGVSCIAVEECEAVGYDLSSAPEEEGLAYRWVKGTWTYQKTEKPAGTNSWRLEGISCTSTEFCNAVGVDGNGKVLLPFGEVYK